MPCSRPARVGLRLSPAPKWFLPGTDDPFELWSWTGPGVGPRLAKGRPVFGLALVPGAMLVLAFGAAPKPGDR